MGPIQILPTPIEQGLFRIIEITPWLFQTEIIWYHEKGTPGLQREQVVLCVSYYLIHPFYGQLQVKIACALEHLIEFQITRGEGWSLPEVGPEPPLQPSQPLVIAEKPQRGFGR